MITLLFAGWFAQHNLCNKEYLCNSVSRQQSIEVFQAELKSQNPNESHIKYV